MESLRVKCRNIGSWQSRVAIPLSLHSLPQERRLPELTFKNCLVLQVTVLGSRIGFLFTWVETRNQKPSFLLHQEMKDAKLKEDVQHSFCIRRGSHSWENKKSVPLAKALGPRKTACKFDSDSCLLNQELRLKIIFVSFL